MEYPNPCQPEELIQALIELGAIEIECTNRSAAYSFAHGVMEGAGIDHAHWPWSNYKAGQFPSGLEFGKAIKAAAIAGVNVAVKSNPFSDDKLPLVVVYTTIYQDNKPIGGV